MIKDGYLIFNNYICTFSFLTQTTKVNQAAKNCPPLATHVLFQRYEEVVSLFPVFFKAYDIVGKCGQP